MDATSEGLMYLNEGATPLLGLCFRGGRIALEESRDTKSESLECVFRKRLSSPVCRKDQGETQPEI